MASHEDTIQICSRCGKSYPLTTQYFLREKRNRSGLTTYCRDCKRQKQAAWDAAHPEQVRAYKHEWYVTHRREQVVRDRKRRETHAEEIRVYKHGWYLDHRSEQSEREKKKRQEHPEVVAAAAKASRQRHRAKRLAEKKAWYFAHRDAILARSRALYPQIKQQLSLARKTYREKNWNTIAAQKRVYYAANPDKSRAAAARRNARKRTLPARYTATQWQAAKAYWHYACAVCGAEEGFWWTLAMDHWVPLADATCPGTIATNIVPLCDGRGGCNSSKKDKEPVAWLLHKLGTRQGKRKLAEIEAFFLFMDAHEKDIG